ncbi:MAG: ABC transporter permease [Planctomycetaceae bacterium]|nr:ABC transporter permease [Planctomycetaceae bacterium]
MAQEIFTSICDRPLKEFLPPDNCTLSPWLDPFMIIGPVFTREVTIAPRRERTFISRSVYAGVLLLLISTAWLVVTGTQLIRDTGDFARFGNTLFQILAPLQLVIFLFFSGMLAAGAVAQEKDRKTLLLLLLTRMSNMELVLGKLFSSLLMVLTLLLVSVPVFMLITLLGGVSYTQIFRVFLVTLLSVLTCGSLGSCVALWREKTFQALAITVLVLMIWLGFWETVSFGILGRDWLGFSTLEIARAFSPWQAILLASRPSLEFSGGLTGPIAGFSLCSILLGILINGTAIVMVRVWNPSRELRQTGLEQDTWRKESTEISKAYYRQTNLSEQTLAALAEPTGEDVHADIQATKEKNAATTPHAAPGKVRHVWDNPVIWREICTRAYGRKTLVIRFAYLMLAVCFAWAMHSVIESTHRAGFEVTVAQLAGPFVPLLILSLVLVNTQAVTALTSERDGGTFDLLLASDITPKEFVFGKIGGTFYNMKEMVLFPLALAVYFWWADALSGTNAAFLFLGLTVLYAFVAMIGIHIGMQYDNTRSAVATSLGIVFFLFIGISTCMWIMVAFSGQFGAQLQPFLAFMIGGGVGLYVVLGAKNPSAAIGLASFVLPLATFYAITSLLMGFYHLVFIAMVAAYGFTTVAMLIPAIDEFDVATGRTTAD